MANVEQRAALNGMFDEVMLNARRNSIVLLFILCIFRKSCSCSGIQPEIGPKSKR